LNGNPHGPREREILEHAILTHARLDDATVQLHRNGAGRKSGGNDGTKHQAPSTKHPKWTRYVAIAAGAFALGLVATSANAAYTWTAHQIRTGGVAYNGSSGDCDYIYDVLLSNSTTWGDAYTMTTSSCTAGEVRHYYYGTAGWAGWTSWHFATMGNTADTEDTHNVQRSEHYVDN